MIRIRRDETVVMNQSFTGIVYKFYVHYVVGAS